MVREQEHMEEDWGETYFSDDSSFYGPSLPGRNVLGCSFH